ncbi:hypothetical protein QYE76_034857 [Lolium multiflorum]|uniref:DUF4216 domain-containing protein n=1 Tax=Lolium multiflorum TaxID=4521 RepID=A0AAD8R0G2_LOLMU|nr:hypothetical protein QYE76_034857 [Lolium multiflorum]
MEYSRLCRCGGDGHLEALTGDNIDLIAAHLDVTDTVRLAACSRELYDQISNDEGKMHHWDEPCLLMPPPAYWFDDPWFVATASRLHVTVYDLVPLDHPRRSVTLPFMHDRKWLGANGDWIAAADHRGCQWCLVNVYTERHIPLPSPPDPKIGHGVTYQPATKDWLYYLCWSRAINLLKIVICQVPTKGGRYADYKLIALFDKRIFYLEGGGDWRMLKNPTPEQIVPAFCDAIELGGQVFAVDEIRGWTYCWDTPNENPMSMFVIPPPVVDDQQYAWFLAPSADGKRLMIILTVNNIGIANAEVPHDIPYAANGLQLRQYPPVATYVFEQDPISLFIAARAGDFHWRQVNSLGDHSLFLGLNYPIIANLKKRESKAPDGTLVPFMRKNCVYTAYRKYLHNQYPKILRCNLQPDEDETEYYGVLQEVLELQYGSNKHGDRSVYLFRCDWFDLASRGSKIKDDGYFKSVNTSVLWFKNSPFILASQAETCFYLEDTKFGDPWKVVQKFSHRHVYDVPELEDGNDDAFVRNEDAYQEDEGSVDHTFHDVVDLDEEAEVEAEEDDHRADEVVRIHDARTIRELENGEDSPNVDMDMSEDELQNEEESLIMEENIHDDEGKNSEEDSDVD